MHDYAVTIKVRNNRLLAKMREVGCASASALHRASGVSQAQIGAYLGMTKAPIVRGGKWSETAIKLANHLRCLPEDMFPLAHIRTALAKNTTSFTADATDIHQISASLRTMALPTDEKMMIAESSKALSGLLDTLSPRERIVLEQRFGLVDGVEKTLKEIGKGPISVTGGTLTKDRVRGLEYNALRKLRERARRLGVALSDNGHE